MNLDGFNSAFTAHTVFATVTAEIHSFSNIKTNKDTITSHAGPFVSPIVKTHTNANNFAISTMVWIVSLDDRP